MLRNSSDLNGRAVDLYWLQLWLSISADTASRSAATPGFIRRKEVPCMFGLEFASFIARMHRVYCKVFLL